MLKQISSLLVVLTVGLVVGCSADVSLDEDGMLGMPFICGKSVCAGSDLCAITPDGKDCCEPVSEENASWVVEGETCRIRGGK